VNETTPKRGLITAGCLHRTDPVQSPQINQNLDQGILINDVPTIPDFGSLDTECDGLGVDPLGGGALFVDLFVGLTIPIKLRAQTSADTGG
jgi:hypothetical protein